MVKQIHSMQRMQAHMPEMKSIQQKYKGDKQRLNEELMKFYKENEINPAASCLPMLVQLPVFFALYFVLRNFAKHVAGAAARARLADRPEHHREDHRALVGLHPARRLRGQPGRLRVLRPAAGDAEVAALPVHDPAGRLRPGDHAVPGRPAHVLDDDQPLDDRPGHRHPPADAQARTSTEAFVSDRAEGGGRRQRSRAEPAQAPKPQTAPAVAGPPRRVKRKKRKGGR